MAVSDRGAVVAWDLPTRLFHWTLLALVVSAWVSVEFSEVIGDELLNWHRANGLAIMTLIVWRLLWGIAGSSTSRFSSFLSGPKPAFQYGRDLIAGRAPVYLGHNPLGALMVVAFIIALLLQASFGLFAIDDNDLTGGPLYRLLDRAGNKFATRWHGRVFDGLLLPLIALHITVNLYYAFVKREPLIKAMVSGQKPGGDYADAAAADIPMRPMARALVCLFLAAAIVFGTILGLGGRFT